MIALVCLRTHDEQATVHKKDLIVKRSRRPLTSTLIDDFQKVWPSGCMKRLFPRPLPNRPETLLTKAGYVRHCVEAGRACYHRRLNDPPFPRFHLYMSQTDKGMELDLHFDALDSILHKGNHDKTWAYQGGRIDEEMRRIVNVVYEGMGVKQVYHPLGHPTQACTPPPKKKRSLLDLILRSF